MPRALPWLAQASNGIRSNTTSSFSPASRRKRPTTPSDDLVDSDLNTTGVGTPKQRAKRRTGRSPSTSPPPALPSTEYMQEGYDADDIWLMVEDEFYATAQTFTQHIHHAEYVRLKKLAKARGANTLQAIARPTDGRTEQSVSTKIRLEAEARERKAKAGLKGFIVESDEEEDRDAYMHDPQLAGLMTSSQRAAPDLTGLSKPRAKTRAAAGFLQSPQKARRQRNLPIVIAEDVLDGADSDSDRDSGMHRSHHHKPQKPPRAHATDDTISARKLELEPHAKEPARGVFKRFASDSNDRKSSSRPEPTTTHTPDRHKVRPANTTESPVAGSSKPLESVSPSGGRSQATANFLARRRAREAARLKAAETEEKQKSKNTIDVPTFIF